MNMKEYIWTVIRALVIIAFLIGALIILSGCAPMIAFEDCNHEPVCIEKALAREDRKAERNERDQERKACRYPNAWDVGWKRCIRVFMP